MNLETAVTYIIIIDNAYDQKGNSSNILEFFKKISFLNQPPLEHDNLALLISWDVFIVYIISNRLYFNLNLLHFIYI